jgi:ATP-binding cassette subfamily B protein RaxB
MSLQWHALGLNLSGLRRLQFVHQAEATECSLACLAMIADWYGYETDLSTLRRRFPISLNGTTLRQLIDIAAQLGLTGRAIRCELSMLASLRTPCILHWEFAHFVVLKKVRGDRAWLHDPAVGVRIMKLSEISECFTGVALEITPADDFTPKRERRPLRMRELWRWQPEMRSALGRAILLSFCIELFVLLSPYYMQLVVDQAILKGDVELLTVLAIGFAFVATFNVVAATLRSLVMQFLANVLSFDMGARLLRHLLRLPLDYFQKRNLGDLLQRFQSLGPIKQFILTGGITTIIDGVLGCVTLTLLLLYSMNLGMLVLGVVLLYVALRVLVLGIARRLAMDSMVAGAREQAQFLETIRAIQTVKATGGEAARESEWLNLYVAELNASIRVGNLGIAYSAASGLLAAISDVLIVFIAARQVMDAKLTIGIITAFLAYKSQFMSRIMSLADQFIQYRMLDVQLERIADIALAEPERSLTTPLCDGSEPRGDLELRNLVFRYSDTEKPVLDHVNLRIRAGEFVAIVGASGDGKSTLIKVLVGLYAPTGGEVLLDGRPLPQVDAGSFRRRLGIVMQEDRLFTGSISENIALFDRSPDMERIRECARLAQIDEEIMCLPMRYHTQIGDLGTSLSAGQRQRVLLARALYRAPAVLVLDEGTANVGPECEARIMQAIRELRATRIVATHSPYVAGAADRVILMQHGRATELRRVPANETHAGTTNESIRVAAGGDK